MKMRKWIAVLLCLMLAATSSVSLAATEYSLKVTPGDEIASQEAIKDLFDVLTLKILSGENSGQLTVSISDTDLLSLAMRLTGNGLYAQSAILGDSPVFISAEDLAALMETAAGEQGGGTAEAGQAAAESVMQWFGQIDTMQEAMQSAKPESVETLSFEEEKEAAKAAVDEQFADDPAMAEFVKSFLDRAELTEGDFSSDRHDPATQCVKMTMTEEDFVALAKSTTLQQSSSMTEEELLKALQQVELDMKLLMYLEGDELVAAAMTLAEKVSQEAEEGEEPETEDVWMNAEYNRLTANGVAEHSLTMLIGEEDETEMTMAFLLTDADGVYNLEGAANSVEDGREVPELTVKGALEAKDETKSGWLGMCADDTQITLTLEATENEKLVGLYVRNDASAATELAASERPVLSLQITIDRNASEEALATLDAATEDTSVQPMRMSEEEMTEFVNALSTNAMQVLYAALSVMPASVLNLFMTAE